MEPLPQPASDDAQPSTDDEFAAFDIDALAALAEFEAEHRRTLAMQSLYLRRNRAGGAA